VEHLHIARSFGAPVEAVQEIEVVKEVGVVGDRHAVPAGEWNDSHVGEELTLVEAEELERLARDHDIHLRPGETRRTVTTRGIALNDLVGRRFKVGEVEAVAIELCEPCQHLTSLLGKPILRPLAHRAGIRVQLLNSGRIRVGDSVEGAGDRA
jgi:MOSC domain-containing protein YiiM